MKLLVLLGSGEFTDSTADIDKLVIEYLKEQGITSPTVSILPTAAGLEDTVDYWIKLGKKHFQKLGVNAKGIKILNNSDANKESLVEDALNSDWIYFSGGNPGHLLTSLKDSKLWKGILEKYNSGTPLSGCSAGAMVMGKYVFSNPYGFEEKSENPKFDEGFGLTEFTIFPHYEYIKDKMLEKIRSTSDKKYLEKLVGISEDTAMIIEDEKMSVLGVGTVHMFNDNDERVFKNQDID